MDGDTLVIERRHIVESLCSLIFKTINENHIVDPVTEYFAIALDPNSYHELRIVSTETARVFTPDTSECLFFQGFRVYCAAVHSPTILFTDRYSFAAIEERRKLYTEAN